MKSTMVQEVPAPEPLAEKKGMFKSFVDDVKMAARNLMEDSRRGHSTKIEIDGSEDLAEVYTEVTRTERKKAHAHVVWKIKNTSARFPLIANL